MEGGTLPWVCTRGNPSNLGRIYVRTELGTLHPALTAAPGTEKALDMPSFTQRSCPRCAAREILVPQPEFEPSPHAVAAQSVNHWTAREVPVQLL